MAHAQRIRLGSLAAVTQQLIPRVIWPWTYSPIIKRRCAGPTSHPTLALRRQAQHGQAEPAAGVWLGLGLAGLGQVLA